MSFRIAFATTDHAAVDAHLGWAPHLDVYEVSLAGARLVDSHAFARAGEDGDHGKLAARLAALEGCAILYADAVGPTAAAQLAARRIRPIAGRPGEPIPEVLGRLARLLGGTPPPWLRKLLQPGGAGGAGTGPPRSESP